MKTIEISEAALERATPAQLDRVAVLLTSHRATKITVTADMFGLPKGYVSFKVEYEDGGQPMYGGIDVDGRAST